MVFSSLLFLFQFLPLVIICYYLSPKSIRNLILLVASLVFYAWGEPRYILVMLFSIVANFILVLIMGNQEKHSSSRRKYFIIIIILNLLLLGLFKYAGFMTEIINKCFSCELTIPKITLPIGISFYTFQILSYVIDVYRGNIQPQSHFTSFALYVTMFPQLVAGPIVKYSDVEFQMEHRSERFIQFGEGVNRFIIGLGKKILLANNIGVLWITIRSLAIEDLSISLAWIGVLSYTFQIYFDFSGYSDMAIGLGKMFGFKFEENFNYPYLSKSITEFWRRWHISLGSWFREYLYIPLGGNKRGIRRQVINLFIVWFLTGLWHGASWNFIVWGIYYGILLFIEKILLNPWFKKAPNTLLHLYTMFFIMIGWMIFAIEDLGSLGEYLKIMFGFGGIPLWSERTLYELSRYGILFVFLIMGSTPLVKRLGSRITRNFPIISCIVIIGLFILCIASLVNSTYNPFLYFRF